MDRQRDFFRGRIARRVVLLFVACALVPMSLLALFALHGVTQQTDERAEAYLGRVCRDASRLAVNALDDIDVELQDVADHLGGMLDTPDVQRLLVESWKGASIQGLGLYQDGVLVAASRAFDTEMVELAPNQRQHLAGGEALLLGRKNGPEPDGLVLLRRIPDGSGRELVIAGQATTAQLLRQYDFARDDVEFCAFLLGDRLLASTLAAPGSNAALLRAVGESIGGSGPLAVDIAEDPWLAFHRTTFLRPRFLTDVGVVAGIVRSEARGPVVYFQRIFVLITILSIGAVFLLATTQIRRYLHPLASLQSAAGRVAAGDYTVRTAIETGDELEDLSRAFDEMAACVRARTAELERANRAKSDFMANVSHELRTPMTSILGYVDLCLEAQGTQQERESHLRVVAASGRHLLAVINDILDFSRIEAGRFTVAREPCSPAQIVSDVASLMAVAAKQKGISFDVTCAEGLPVRVLTDAMRVRQILLNLVGNAIKFTEHGRVELALRCTRDPVGLEQLAFEVRDTGCGIAPEDVERMFEPFAQADGSRTRRHGGTGLGLTIARHLARALGGDIACRSVIGVGSSFTLTIDPGPLADVERANLRLEDEPGPALPEPAAPERAPGPLRAAPLSPAPTSRVHARFAGERILLAEDVAVNRKLVCTMLERGGLVVETAENGRVAADKFAAAVAAGAPFDLVLTDMQMPEMDGYELARHLRSFGFAGPIVALTAHTMDGEREHCLAAGCDDFATKPVDRATLYLVLARQLARRDGAHPT